MFLCWGYMPILPCLSCYIRKMCNHTLICLISKENSIKSSKQHSTCKPENRLATTFWPCLNDTYGFGSIKNHGNVKDMYFLMEVQSTHIHICMRIYGADTLCSMCTYTNINMMPIKVLIYSHYHSKYLENVKQLAQVLISFVCVIYQQNENQAKPLIILKGNQC